MEIIKVCTKCKIKKPKSKFYKHSSTKDGLMSNCKECSLINARRTSKENGYRYNPKAYNKWGSGVYGIFENGECLYVGESSTLYRRICQHNMGYKDPQKANSKDWIPFYESLQQHKNLTIGILEQTENHKEKEKFYINNLNPKYNGTY